MSNIRNFFHPLGRRLKAALTILINTEKFPLDI